MLHVILWFPLGHYMNIDQAAIYADINRGSYYIFNWYRSSVGCGDVLLEGVMLVACLST